MKTNLIDFIDFDRINTLLEGFNKTTGFVTAILDLEGNILSKSGWRSICSDFHRANAATAKRCTISDTLLAGKMAEGEKYHYYKCLNGLVDVAVPLVINGKHIANLFSGQFFFEEPDRDLFLKQAAKYGFNEERYMEALKKAPVVSEEKVQIAMDFLLNMTQLISEMTYQKQEQAELNQKLKESEHTFRKLFEDSSDANLLLDEQNVFVECNQAALDLLKMTREQFLYLKPEDISPEFQPNGKSSKEAASEMIEIANKNGHNRFDWTHIDAEGSEFIVDISMMPVVIKGRKMLHTSWRDITESMKAEEENRVLADIIRKSGDFIGVADPEGRAFFVNPAGKAMMGFDEEFKEETTVVEDYFFPEDMEIVRNEILPTVMEKGRWAGEFRFRHFKTGEPVHVYYDLFLTSDPSTGKVQNLSTVTRNITERKLNEEALKKSEEKFRRLAENSPSIIYRILLKPETKFDYVSPSATAITGYTPEDHYADPQLGFKLVHPDDRKLLEDAIRLSNGEPFTLRWIKKDGTVIYTEQRNVLIYDQNNEPFAIEGEARDITERKEAEQALKESEEKYRQLLQNLHAGVVVHAADSSIRYANEQAVQLLGLTIDQLMGKTAIDPAWHFVQEDFKPIAIEDYPVQFVITKQEPLREKVLGIHRTETNDLIWVLINAFPEFEADGSLRQIVVTFIDITERKQAEEALEKRIIALTMPLDNLTEIQFEDLFNLDSLQKLQDDFSAATGVASIITRPDGIPITQPSNFTFLCNNIIRKTEKGCENCFKSDALLGKSLHGPTIQPCLSGGLWDAGTGISVGGKHIANWLIGQVRNEDQNEEAMLAYAKEIGADETAFIEAFRKVPAMSKEQFKNIAQVLYTLSAQLSVSAYQNVQQARFITQTKQAEQAQKESEEKYRHLLQNLHAGVVVHAADSSIRYANEQALQLLGLTIDQLMGKTAIDPAWHFVQEDFKPIAIEDYPAHFVIAKQEPLREKVLGIHRAETNDLIWVLIDAFPEFEADGSLRQIVVTFIDITERINNEKTLLFTQFAIDHSADSAYWMDENAHFIYVNEVACKTRGYSKEEFLSMTVMDLDPDFPLHVWVDHMKDLEKFGNIIFETVHTTKDGRHIPVEVNANFLEFNQKKYNCAFVRDITERKQTESKLIIAKEKAERNENELKKAQKIAHLGSWFLDLETNQVVWTEELFKMYGFDPALPVPPYTEHMKLFTPESWELLSNSLAKTAETNIPYELELKTVKNDGSNGWMWVRGETVADAEGRTIGLWGAAQDITDRKHNELLLKEKTEEIEVRNEELVDSIAAYAALNEEYAAQNEELQSAIEKLEESEAKFREMAELLPQIIFECDMQGILTYVNKQASKLTGYSEQDGLIGKSTLSFYIPEDRERAIENLSLSLTGKKQAESNEYTMTRKDGFPFNVLIYSNPIVKDNMVVGLRGIIVDITELKRTEKELVKAKERAEESDRLKSAFLANMSHEIRTPMNGILGFAELLKEPNLSGEEQKRFIGIIEKSGARMLNIINDIVNISKIEAGLMEVNRQDSNVNEQIEYIYTFFKPEVESKGMQLSFRNPLPANEAILKTDREKVYAILTNLVKNAIKYSNQGSIEFGYSLKTNEKHSELEFFVKDTGIGIPKDRQEAIFERFVQADIADKNALQGAGLGLSISKAYVEMLGGKMWVESEVGTGSTFYFTLPYQSGIAKEKSPVNEILPALETATMRKLKVLIAEDDMPSEILISMVVKKLGYDIICVRTGTEAVEVCHKNPDIDLVLMDILLPGLDGYEATRQIRKFNSDIFIIAQTAYAMEGDRKKALSAGCNDYIAKPIKLDALKHMITAHFSQEK